MVVRTVRGQGIVLAVTALLVGLVGLVWCSQVRGALPPPKRRRRI